MADKYSKKANEIMNRFATPIATEWVRKHGLAEKANALEDQMKYARSDEQFDNAAYDFKRLVVVPYFYNHVANLEESEIKEFISSNPIFNMKPPHYLGSYDELKKNDAFIVVPYAKEIVDKDGKRSVDVPLLRVADDYKTLSAVAPGLHVTPEDLRDHIRNEWKKKKDREWAAEEKAMKKEVIAQRNKIANDYGNSWYGTVLNAIAPETTAKTLEEIRSGNDFGAAAENKAIVSDALVGLGTVVSGNAAGSALRHVPRFANFLNKNVLSKLGYAPKVASDLSKFKANMVLKNPATQAVAGGTIDAGLEAYRQGVSDYYEFDPKAIARVGSVSATLPAAVGFVTSRASGIPFMGRITRPLSRRLREMQPKPGDEEFLKNSKIYNDARMAVNDAKNAKDPVKEVRAIEKLNEVMEFVNNSPYTKLGKEKTFKDIEKLVENPKKAGKYFVPPKAEDVNKAYKKMRSSKKDVSDNAEEWLNRVKSQWGANYNEIMNGTESMSYADKVGTILTDFASREETQRSRSTGKMKGIPSENLRYVMENDPVTIRTWENGFVPNDKESLDLYKEWQEKFGGRK